MSGGDDQGTDVRGPVMGSSRVELFESIRRDARREDLSVRALAERHHVHRRTVCAALESPVPPPRRPRVSPAPVLGPVKPLIDAMLIADLALRGSSATPHAGCMRDLSMSMVRRT